MPEAAALVTNLLELAIPRGGFRMSVPVVFLVARMGRAPLLTAIAHGLSVKRIGANLATVIIAATLPLAFRLAANPLLGTIRRRLKGLMTIQATAITHRLAPDQNGIHSFCPEHLRAANAPTQNSGYIETAIEWYRLPAHGTAALQTGTIAALLHRRGHGKPDLVNFDFESGVYIIPEIVDKGYLVIGKQKVSFERRG